MDKRNNHGDGVIQLEGHVFKRVKQGLDEEQVLSFANELISQRDNLLHRQAHLSSLIELAERTVAEADNIAQKIRQEAVDKARVDAEEIIAKLSKEAEDKAEQDKARTIAEAEEEVKGIRAKAEEQAAKTKAEAEDIIAKTQVEAEGIIVKTKAEVETIRTKAQAEVEVIKANAQAEVEAIKVNAQEQAKAIKASAQEQAEAIRVSAQEQTEAMRKELTNNVKSEVGDIAQRLYRELLAEIENVRQQIIATESDFERTLSQFGEQANTTPKESENNELPPMDIGSDESPEAIHNISAAILEKMQTDEQADTKELEEKALTMIESLEASEENNLVTLEVLPPVDIHRIMGVISQLEELPEVRTTELIPVMPKPLITVFLKEPLRLVEVLKTFPEIKQIEEVLGTEETGTTGTEKKQNRIQITFSDDFKVAQKSRKT